MPRAWSVDLRERVLAACDEGGLRRSEIAQRFGVGESTLYDWRKRRKETGRVAPLAQRHGPLPQVRGEAEAVLRALVEEQNDRTLAEYVDALAEQSGGVRVSTSALDRALQRLALPRKKRRSGPPSGTVPT